MREILRHQQSSIKNHFSSETDASYHARYTTEIAAFFIRAELFYVAAWTAPNLNYIMSPDTWWAFSICDIKNKLFFW